MTVLEDALLEAPAKDRPAILDLLRQSYEVLARKAEASGRTREAAHYRDNLAILGRSREPGRQARPIESRPESPTRSKAAPAGKAAPDGPRTALPAARPPTAPAQAPVPGIVLPILPEPAPLPEPERIPPPDSPRGRVPIQAGSDARTPRVVGAATGPGKPSLAGTTRLPNAGLPIVADATSDRDSAHASRSGLPPLPDPDQADTPAEDINPGSGTPEAESKNSADRNPGAAPQPDGGSRPHPLASVRRRIPTWTGPITSSRQDSGMRRAASMGPWPARTGCRRIAGRTGPIAGRARLSGRSMPIPARRASGTRSKRRSGRSIG